MKIKVQFKSGARYVTAKEIAYYFGSRYMYSYQTNTAIPKGIRQYVHKWYNEINNLLSDVDDAYRLPGSALYLAPILERSEGWPSWLS